MRPVDLSQNKTAKLYQAGLSREEAEAKGANMAEFDRFEETYKGGSIPAHEMGGFKKTEPYSSDYHTGGAQGALLREIIRQNNCAAGVVLDEPADPQP